MARWAIPPKLHSEISGGPLCFKAEHAIGCRDGLIPRYSDSHACVRCITDLTQRRVALDVHAIHAHSRPRFLEFWSLVQLGPPDTCWTWQGAKHISNGTGVAVLPRHWSSSRQYSAQRVAFWFTWGDIGRLPIKTLCGNSNCCNPLHLRAVGVPHHHHGAKLSRIELEFSVPQLHADALAFLQTARHEDPKVLRRLRRANAPWIEQLLARHERDSTQVLT
jgi:hypothetical protein